MLCLTIQSCDKLPLCTCTKYSRPYLGGSTGSIFIVYMMMEMNEKRNWNPNFMEAGCSTIYQSDLP